MPLSDSEVRSLEAGDKRKVVSVGESFHIVVYPVGTGCGKYFVARMRHPPGAGIKQVEVRSAKVQVSGLLRFSVMPPGSGKPLAFLNV